MGHAVSRRSSWVSHWKALFSTTKGGDISGTPQGRQKSGFSKSFKAGVTGSLLALARKPLKRISKCRPPESAPPHFKLEYLPPELILKIEQYLPPSSALSLSYTCSRFRQTMKAKVEDLTYLVDMLSVLRNSKESVDESVVSSQRLAFLCMLERDGRLSPSRAICGVCKVTHHVSMFSSTNLQQRSHWRRCMDPDLWPPTRWRCRHTPLVFEW